MSGTSAGLPTFRHAPAYFYGVLLEREAQLAAVEACLSGAVKGSGSLVFIGGEAGVGKSSLVETVAARASDGGFRVLVGACDALSTPRPLGPVHDLAAALADDAFTRQLLAEPKAFELLAALLAILRQGGPWLVVIEDLHWSDAATLDLVRYLGRRITTAPAVVVVTFRDDEIEDIHPLRMLIGELSGTSGCTRLTLPPLSPTAVTRLAEEAERSVDSEDLYRKTRGNPFFVTEVLAAPSDDLPGAVRDAVLARAARLSAPARAVLEVAALVPLRVELDLLLACCPRSEDAIDECQRTSALVADGEWLRFRHELARIAIESEIPLARRRQLHRRILEFLRSPAMPDTDAARLVHHALAGADYAAVVELAPTAGRWAAAVGAHRESASHFEAAASAAGRLRHPAAQRASLMDAAAQECYLSDQHEEALSLQRQALDVWRHEGDGRRVGAALYLISRLAEFRGMGADARTAASEAVTTLEAVERSPELARAYLNMSQLAMASDDVESALLWAERAKALAEALGQGAIAVEALVNQGMVALEHARDHSDRLLGDAIERARADGYDEALARGLLDLACARMTLHRYAAARAAINESRAVCDERGLEVWGLMVDATSAWIDLDTGDLGAAAAASSRVLRRSPGLPCRADALMVLGRARARRADPGVWDALDEAMEIADRIGEVHKIGPVAAARLEASLLLGARREEMIAGAEQALRVIVDRGVFVYAGDLAVWLVRADRAPDHRQTVLPPWSLELRGEAEAAAEAWGALGRPYEAAMALAWSEAVSDDARRQALRDLQELGATGAAAFMTRHLRDEGATGLPRGAHASTRANPGRLTTRQLEILRLLTEGLSNAEMAERLCVSKRTVDHHVEAVLAKLGVRSRAAAVATAIGRGILPPAEDGYLEVEK
jgi:DNA-binding CsgD family transcriptional regulator